MSGDGAVERVGQPLQKATVPFARALDSRRILWARAESRMAGGVAIGERG